MTQIRGTFTWKCYKCGAFFKKDTPQGLGLAKSNHNRKHSVKYGH